MNVDRYGQLALDHIKMFLPARYAQIADPESYFAGLGEEIGAQVEELTDMLAGPAPAGEDWTTRVGRLNMARLMAEEKVFAELVYLPPEYPTPNHQIWGSERSEVDETGAYVGASPEWEAVYGTPALRQAEIDEDIRLAENPVSSGG